MDEEPRFRPIAPVLFTFKLPATLLLRAEPGLWGRAPRSVSLDVAHDGLVVVTCTDLSELHARGLVISTTGAFIRSIDRNAPVLKIPALMTVRSVRRPIEYMIVIGARVSIARTGEAPATFANPLLAVAS